jgi:hypothetical protein
MTAAIMMTAMVGITKFDTEAANQKADRAVRLYEPHFPR